MSIYDFSMHCGRSLTIITSEMAQKETDERLFPASRNRSKRIHKKLVKRFGGEFRKVPCYYIIGQQVIVHPLVYPDFIKALNEACK